MQTGCRLPPGLTSLASRKHFPVLLAVVPAPKSKAKLISSPPLPHQPGLPEGCPQLPLRSQNPASVQLHPNSRANFVPSQMDGPSSVHLSWPSAQGIPLGDAHRRPEGQTQGASGGFLEEGQQPLCALTPLLQEGEGELRGGVCAGRGGVLPGPAARGHPHC